MFKLLAAMFTVRRLLSRPQSFVKKARLLLLMVIARFRVVSATGFVEQLAVVSAILSLKGPGVVVECGAYQGASTIALSLACALTGRRLYVFDSFEGLPEPDAADKNHVIVRDAQIATYQKGAWCGSLELVQRNVRKYGDLSPCEFIQGYFDRTLPEFDQSVALAFCDVDLLESLKTCLRYLWPLISDGGLLFTHEAHHHEIASLFYDQKWWGEIGFQAPGMIGAGNGLGLSLQADGTLGSCLGYTVKHPTAVRQALELGKHETVYSDCNQVLIR